MHIIDYQHITVDDLNELDNNTLVVDGCLCNNQVRYTNTINNIDKLYHFITYKSTYHNTKVMFKLGEYIEDILPVELELLKERIKTNQDKTFFINPLGILVNGGDVFFHCIRPKLPELLYDYDNVYLLWNNIPKAEEFIKNNLIVSTTNSHEKSSQKKTYDYLKKVGNTVNINRLNNKHIPIELPSGVYVKE